MDIAHMLLYSVLIFVIALVLFLANMLSILYIIIIIILLTFIWIIIPCFTSRLLQSTPAAVEVQMTTNDIDLNHINTTATNNTNATSIPDNIHSIGAIRTSATIIKPPIADARFLSLSSSSSTSDIIIDNDIENNDINRDYHTSIITVEASYINSHIIEHKEEGDDDIHIVNV